MSHPIATCLLEDRDGNLWVGTRGGLNRLNRTTNCFQRFFHQPDHPGSLPGNDVTDIAEGNDGEIYVATTAGLAIYDPQTDKFTPIAKAVEVQEILADERGLFSIGPQGVQLPASLQDAVVPFPKMEHPDIHDLLITGDSLLIATNRGLYYWKAGIKELTSALPADHPMATASVQSLCLTNDHLWLATRGTGLGVMDLKSGSFLQYQTEGGGVKGLLDNHLRALVTDGPNNLWIGGYTGLNRLDLSKSAPRLYNQQRGDGGEPHILELGSDHLGGVYFYERWQGLFRSNGPGATGQQLVFPANDFLIGKDLNHIHTDRAGITWFLRGNDRIYRYDAKEGQFLKELSLPTLADRRLNGIAQDVTDDNIYWLATSKGLGKLNLLQNELAWFSPGPKVGKINGEVLTVVLSADDGKVWLSCGDYYNDRLGYFDPATEQFTLLGYAAGDPENIAGGRVKQLAEHPDGSIWAVASRGLSGLTRTTCPPG